jgi:hypothetical protein
VWAIVLVIDGIVTASDVVTALRGPKKATERAAEPVKVR